jgi:3-deoxy-manno-octulosonate cytidylyltransferase (CMP-KDO synthetase)
MIYVPLKIKAFSWKIHSSRRVFMKVVGVIPARFASTRFPGKMLASIHGKSLIQRTYENAALCPSLDRLMVATDHEAIAKHVRSFGGEVIMTSLGCQNGTERIAEALEKEPLLQDSEILVNIQGDHPCIHKETIASVIQALKEDEESSLSTAVSPLKDPEEIFSSHVVKCVFDQKKRAIYFSRSPIPYHKKAGVCYYYHVGIYAYRTSFLPLYVQLAPSPLQEKEDLEQLKAIEHGYKIKVAIVNEKVLGVDIPEDIHKVEKIVCR